MRYRNRALWTALQYYYSGQFKSYYLDKVSGDDANSGLASDDAFATMGTALTAIGTQTSTLYINSTIDDPVLGFFTLSNAARITFRPYPGNASWVHTRASQIPGAWSDQGGGIFRSSYGANPLYVFVSTLDDADGKQLDDGTPLETELAKNTGTPTTPAEGEFGIDGGFIYVFLPGGVDPTSHTLLRGQLNEVFTVDGTGTYIFHNMICGYSNQDGIAVDNGTVILHNCLFPFVRVTVNGGMFTAYDSIAYRGADCWSINGDAIVNLYRCEGAWAEDEGISPHATSVLTLTDCIVHHAAHSGAGSANSSTMNVSGGEYYENGQDPGTGFEKGHGVAFGADSSGSCTNADLRDNNGSGFYCSTSGTVTESGNTSGIANGNGDADVAC